MGRTNQRIAGLFFFLTSSFLNTPNAFADVNMMEASFQTSFIDLEIGRLKLTRTYNSRSNFSGIFGFGWCSPLDARMQTSTAPDGTTSMVVNDCGHLEPINSNVQHLKSGLVRRFSASSGELVGLSTETGPEIFVLRGRSRLPRAAALGEGKMERQRTRPVTWLILEFDDANENVLALETSLHQHVEFRYSPSRDLLSARNAWGNTYRYNYDRLHNLTEINYPDRTSEHMTYDSDLDRILSFTGRDGDCRETYAYKFDEPTSASIRMQTSASRLICAGQVKRTTLFDFTYKRNRTGPWTLANLKITRGGK